MSRQTDTIEATKYRIRKITGHNNYRIVKTIMDVETDSYSISIKLKPALLGTYIDELWCDCPGFRIQQYPKEQHKHIVLGMDYIARGEPEWVDYRMTGTGKNAKIHFIGDSNE